MDTIASDLDLRPYLDTLFSERPVTDPCPTPITSDWQQKKRERLREVLHIPDIHKPGI